MAYPKLIEELLASLSKLPGIGHRSSERIVYHILKANTDEVEALAKNILSVKNNLKLCRLCYHLSDNEICNVCNDPVRDSIRTLCVVEESKDVLAIERTGAYKGRYHVLLGAIAPSEGRGPENLTIGALMNRIECEEIKEVIIATDPDNDGELTSLYLTRELRKKDVTISRIGLGLPMGSAVEYVDASTLGMSLTTRRDITVEAEKR
ncbi:MAG: recombination protein RecR [Lysobacterales bacterium]|jgi:recombination protein RecR